MFPSVSKPSLVRAASALVAAAALWACRAPSHVAVPPRTAVQDGTVEPVPLVDDGLSYKDRRQRDALLGFDYDGERLELVADEAAELVAGPDPELSRRELARGRELLERNLRLDAIAAFTRAVLAAPDEGEPYEALGDALLARRWSRRAELAFRAGVEVAPTSPTLRFKLGDALMRQGKLDESLVELREAVALDPAYGLAHARLAVELYFAHDYAAAWRAVDLAEANGGSVPPQFEVLLAQQLPDPRPANEKGR